MFEYLDESVWTQVSVWKWWMRCRIETVHLVMAELYNSTVRRQRNVMTGFNAFKFHRTSKIRSFISITANNRPHLEYGPIVSPGHVTRTKSGRIAVSNRTNLFSHLIRSHNRLSSSPTKLSITPVGHRFTSLS